MLVEAVERGKLFGQEMSAKHDVVELAVLRHNAIANVVGLDLEHQVLLFALVGFSRFAARRRRHLVRNIVDVTSHARSGLFKHFDELLANFGLVVRRPVFSADEQSLLSISFPYLRERALCGVLRSGGRLYYCLLGQLGLLLLLLLGKHI